MRVFIVLISLLFTSYAKAQSFKNYVEVSKLYGDLNGDGQKDKIIIFEKVCAEGEGAGFENSKCRRVAVYLKANGRYMLYGYNDKVIECSNCGGAGVGDPGGNIKIKNQEFSITSMFGACDKTIEVVTFKFEKTSKQFYLYRIVTEDYSCREEANPDGEIVVKTKVRTKKDFGRVKFTDY